MDNNDVHGGLVPTGDGECTASRVVVQCALDFYRVCTCRGKLKKQTQVVPQTCHITWCTSSQINGQSLHLSRDRHSSWLSGVTGTCQVPLCCFTEAQMLTCGLFCQSQTFIDLTATDFSVASQEWLSVLLS